MTVPAPARPAILRPLVTDTFLKRLGKKGQKQRDETGQTDEHMSSLRVHICPSAIFLSVCLSVEWKCFKSLVMELYVPFKKVTTPKNKHAHRQSFCNIISRNCWPHDLLITKLSLPLLPAPGICLEPAQTRTCSRHSQAKWACDIYSWI